MFGLVQCYTDKASRGLDLDSLTVELKFKEWFTVANATVMLVVVGRVL